MWKLGGRQPAGARSSISQAESVAIFWTTKVTYVIIPPSGAPDGPAGQGTRLGSQATQSFGDGDP
eukprot:6588102-Pyramimonas_sp.AAC.1